MVYSWLTIKPIHGLNRGTWHDLESEIRKKSPPIWVHRFIGEEKCVRSEFNRTHWHRRNVLTQGPGNYLSFDTHRSGIASNLRGFASSPWLAASNQKRCLAFWVNQAAASVTDAARLGALEVAFFWLASSPISRVHLLFLTPLIFHS